MRPMQLPNRPLLLSTRFTVNPNSVQSPPDDFALIPAFDEPLFLDEIRFNFVNKPLNTRPENDIRVELTMGGSQQLTHLPVPLAALNTSPQAYNFTTGPLLGNSVIYTPRNGVTFRLPKPMYLNATNYVDKLIPRIHNNTSQPLTMTVSYACRRAEKGIQPSEIWYPYIASYRTPEFQLDDTSVPFLFESTPNDLINPYSVPLLVDRLVGFIGCDTEINDDPGGLGGYQNRSYVGELINVRLLDTNGRPVVRDLTPFNALFNLQNNAWQARGMLRPHEYYIAQVSYDNNTAADLLVPGILGTPVTTANIVLIGSRRADKVYADRPLNNLDIPQQPGRPPVAEIFNNLPRILTRK